MADTNDDQVVHLSAAGGELWRGGDFLWPNSLSANPSDGSCWVADTYRGQVVHLSPAGEELWRGEGFSRPCSVSVDPRDGSCWVADTLNDQVVHLSADGVEMWRGGGFCAPMSVAIDPRDGSCWIADTEKSQVAHLSQTGTALWRGEGFSWPHSVSVSPVDGSCWVADIGHQVVHLSAAGGELWRGGDFDRPFSISANSADGSCWVADSYLDQVIRLSAAGEELWRGRGLSLPTSVSVDPCDGSCWVADNAHGQVVHLSAVGMEVWRGAGFLFPGSVSVDRSNGSCWVADTSHHQAVHLSAAGEEVWRGGRFTYPDAVSANPSDGSCWVAAAGSWDSTTKTYRDSTVVHLSADGVELWRSGAFCGPVAVNPSDGSCWVTDTSHAQVVHLSASGAELGRSGAGTVGPIAVDSHDGSCWVSDSYHDQVVHLSAEGTELWRGGGFSFPNSVSVNPSDGSCWVADTVNDQVVHLSADGTELWRGGGFSLPRSVSANRSDGSCWVADTGNGQVVHLAVPGDVFRDVNAYYWAYREIMACWSAGIVVGYGDGTYQPALPVSRDQMAAYISRALAGGDANVPAYDGIPHFTDVPTGYWALKYVEYAYANNVVRGYGNGLYGPAAPVDRGEMAAFIARALVSPSGDAAIPMPAGSPTFSDVPSTFWAYKHIEHIAHTTPTVTQGYGDGTYRPGNICTRDQMAVFVARAFAGSAAVPDVAPTATSTDLTPSVFTQYVRSITSRDMAEKCGAIQPSASIAGDPVATIPSHVAVAVYVQEWGEVCWGLVTAPNGIETPVYMDFWNNADGSQTQLFRYADGRIRTNIIYVDGSARTEIAFPDGIKQTVCQEPSVFTGPLIIGDSELSSSDGLSVAYTLLSVWQGVVTQRLTIGAMKGTAELPEGLTQTFSVLTTGARTTGGWTNVRSTQSDGSTFTLSVPTTVGDGPPDFSRTTYGTYADSAATVYFTLTAAPTSFRWTALVNVASDGVAGAFSLNPDFSGSGQLTADGVLEALVSWTREGDITAYTLTGENLRLAPAGAALDFLRHRWQVLTASLGPSPGQ